MEQAGLEPASLAYKLATHGLLCFCPFVSWF